MNISKAILIVIFVMFLILVFFALTGIDLSNPEQAAITMVDKIAQLNRTINRMVRELIFNIRTSFQERFSR
jgi:conjugal transfer/entry exclusion protein